MSPVRKCFSTDDGPCFVSPALGVGHLAAFVANPFAEAVPESVRFGPFKRLAFGVGQDEEPFPLVGGSHGSRREHAPFRIIPHCGQVFENDLNPSTEKTRNIFEKDEGRLDLFDDSEDLRPEPPRVVRPVPLSRNAPRLARESRRHDIHDSTPRLAIEGGKVVPDRSRIQGLVLHPRHESGRSVGFALDVYHTAVSVTEGELESEFEACDPRAEGDSVKSSCGTKVHRTVFYVGSRV